MRSRSMRLYAFTLCLCTSTMFAQSTTQTAAPFPTGDASPLGQQLTAITTGPTVSRAHWGIAVTALDGTPIYGLNEGQLFRPASNTKLFTTAAAMQVIGPDKTYQTSVYGNLDPDTGIVKGDLVLFGGGDANFGSNNLPYITPALRQKKASKPVPLRDLEDLADQVAASGVKHITGRIVGDDTLFPWQPYPEAWEADDLIWGYGAPVSALTIADNQLKLTITPGKVTGPEGHQAFTNATVTLEQNGVPYYTVQPEVTTSNSPPQGIQVERLPGSRTLRVYGVLAPNAPPDVEHIAIDDPAAYAAMALRQMLMDRGIEVRGEAVANHQQSQSGGGFLTALHVSGGIEDAVINHQPIIIECLGSPPVGKLLASHTSAPLSEDVVFTAKVSQNLHAEIMLHHLGKPTVCPGGSTVKGARMVQAFLKHAGLDPDDFILYDGSGLSSHNLVTPRATARLLAYATTQPWFEQWKAGFPVGGEDGTLSGRFAQPPLKDHLFAKTGTLGESRALSGYVDCASGKTVIFSVMVDNHTPTTHADRDAVDSIIAAIAANN